MKRGAEGQAASLAFRLGGTCGRVASALGASSGAVVRTLRGIRLRKEPGLRHARREPAPGAPAAAVARHPGGLAQTLVSPDPAVRMAALRSLVEAPSPQSGRLLAVALVDPDANVRRTAAEVAGKLKAEEAVFCLILALDDASAEVRQAAEQAIAAVTGREVAGGTSPDERRARVSELKQWWKDQRYGQLSRGGAGQDP